MIIQRLWAALMCFTRLPLWRIKSVDSSCFAHVVDYWPIAGWLTGGFMASVFFVSHLFLPVSVAVWIAIAARICLTGALHEDGLADLADATGGSGGSKERMLQIMKDSHIGSFGVIALIIHFALLHGLGTSFDPDLIPVIMLTADIAGKASASWIIYQMPYARTAEQAKMKTIYVSWQGMEIIKHLLRCLVALIPAIILIIHKESISYLWAFIAPIITIMSLRIWFKHKLGGYTGDCCGAAFLICELSFYLFAAALNN